MVQGAGGEGPGGDATGVAAEDREGAGEPDAGAPADGRTGVGVPSPPSLTATIMAPRAAPPGAPPGPPPVRRPDWRRPLRSLGRALTTGPLGRHLALLACYLTVGIAVTWPRATYLVGGKQYVAVVTGMRSQVFPVSPSSAKIVIFGL